VPLFETKYTVGVSRYSSTGTGAPVASLAVGQLKPFPTIESAHRI